MNLKAISGHKWFHPSLGAALTIVGMLAFWVGSSGDALRRASFDYQFLFGTRRPVLQSNEVVFLMMDNSSFDDAGQIRGRPWNRALHARLLDRLTADGCPLVVFDAFFGPSGDPDATAALLEALRRASNVVLMAYYTNRTDQPDPFEPGLRSGGLILPNSNFVAAVGESNCGAGMVSLDVDKIVRRSWPELTPTNYDSLPWVAARLAGARLPEEPKPRWIRYYQSNPDQPVWRSLHYTEAEKKPANFFHNKIVFVGNKPIDDLAVKVETDKFSVSFSRWTGRAVGGVEILITEFLNLMRQEWLRQTPRWVEGLVLVLIGAGLGLGLYGRKTWVACLLALGVAMLGLFGGVYLSYFTDYWFPWLLVGAVEVPLALSCVLVLRYTMVTLARVEEVPDTPDYELVQPHFAEGAYGKVWLARNAVRQWQAIKVIYRTRFGHDLEPYEREFRGVEEYKPVSDRHPGLLRIEFVSRMKPRGYFYYVMELGDPAVPDWEKNSVPYQPLDLATWCARHPKKRVPVRDCVRLAIQLCDALAFLHARGVAHSDIKPRNIIFVQGRPKLADVGLAAKTGRADPKAAFRIGTPSYMPPAPEPVGTIAADIYALGLVLYVISTGNPAMEFPELTATLIDNEETPQFMQLIPIIFRACQPEIADRYPTVDEMLAELTVLEKPLGTH